MIPSINRPQDSRLKRLPADIRDARRLIEAPSNLRPDKQLISGCVAAGRDTRAGEIRGFRNRLIDTARTRFAGRNARRVQLTSLPGVLITERLVIVTDYATPCEKRRIIPLVAEHPYATTLFGPMLCRLRQIFYRSPPAEDSFFFFLFQSRRGLWRYQQSLRSLPKTIRTFVELRLIFFHSLADNFNICKVTFVFFLRLGSLKSLENFLFFVRSHDLHRETSLVRFVDINQPILIINT